MKQWESALILSTKTISGLTCYRKTILYRGETVDSLDELFSHEIGRVVKKLIIRFDDIIRMDDRAIQKLLREIDMATLAKALRGAKAAIYKEEIFSNMSEQAVKLTEEDIAFSDRIDESEIQAARHVVVNMIYTLIDAGETGLPS